VPELFEKIPFSLKPGAVRPVKGEEVGLVRVSKSGALNSARSFIGSDTCSSPQSFVSTVVLLHFGLAGHGQSEWLGPCSLGPGEVRHTKVAPGRLPDVQALLRHERCPVGSNNPQNATYPDSRPAIIATLIQTIWPRAPMSPSSPSAKDRNSLDQSTKAFACRPSLKMTRCC